MAAGHPPNSQALLGNDPLADAAHSLLRRSSPRTSDNRRQTDSGPSTRIDTYWSHQRPPVDRLSGFFSAAPTLEHLKLPLSFFSKEERGLPLWPLYSALCELLHPAPGRRCFSRAWSAALVSSAARASPLRPSPLPREQPSPASFPWFLQLSPIGSHLPGGPPSQGSLSHAATACAALRSTVIHAPLVWLSVGVCLQTPCGLGLGVTTESSAWQVGPRPADGTASLTPSPAVPSLASNRPPIFPFKIYTSPKFLPSHALHQP